LSGTIAEGKLQSTARKLTKSGLANGVERWRLAHLGAPSARLGMAIAWCAEVANDWHLVCTRIDTDCQRINSRLQMSKICTLSKATKRFAVNEEGATAIEYGLIAALIGFGIIAALQNVRDELISLFSYIGGVFQSALSV
jgi:pilus assembly protein Flp/PilA